MRSILRLGLGLSLAAALCAAEAFHGKLIDASCYDRIQASNRAAAGAERASTANLDKKCAPTASTSNFAIETPGKKVYRFDHDGNIKATEAMQSGSLQPDNAGDFHVSLSGSTQGDTVNVDSLQGKTGH
jgi:hypothetical protein